MSLSILLVKEFRSDTHGYENIAPELVVTSGFAGLGEVLVDLLMDNVFLDDVVLIELLLILRDPVKPLEVVLDFVLPVDETEFVAVSEFHAVVLVILAVGDEFKRELEESRELDGGTVS